MIEPLLLTATRVSTFDGKRPLTGASGFFFERDGRLFLVTSRHVVIDEPSQHFPNRIEIELHTDARNLARSIGLSVPLYLDGKSVWRQGHDAGGGNEPAGGEHYPPGRPPSGVLRGVSPGRLPRFLPGRGGRAPRLDPRAPPRFAPGCHTRAP